MNLTTKLLFPFLFFQMCSCSASLRDNYFNLNSYDRREEKVEIIEEYVPNRNIIFEDRNSEEVSLRKLEQSFNGGYRKERGKIKEEFSNRRVKIEYLEKEGKKEPALVIYEGESIKETLYLSGIQRVWGVITKYKNEDKVNTILGLEYRSRVEGISDLPITRFEQYQFKITERSDRELERSAEVLDSLIAKYSYGAFSEGLEKASKIGRIEEKTAVPKKVMVENTFFSPDEYIQACNGHKIPGKKVEPLGTIEFEECEIDKNFSSMYETKQLVDNINSKNLEGKVLLFCGNSSIPPANFCKEEYADYGNHELSFDRAENLGKIVYEQMSEKRSKVTFIAYPNSIRLNSKNVQIFLVGSEEK